MSAHHHENITKVWVTALFSFNRQEMVIEVRWPAQQGNPIGTIREEGRQTWLVTWSLSVVINPGGQILVRNSSVKGSGYPKLASRAKGKRGDIGPALLQ